VKLSTRKVNIFIKFYSLLGNIPHSARPPSFNFTGARLTFVTKLHRNEYAGRRKNFLEELRFFKAAVNSNFELKILSSNRGEEQAKNILEESREMKRKITFSKFSKILFFINIVGLIGYQTSGLSGYFVASK